MPRLCSRCNTERASDEFPSVGRQCKACRYRHADASRKRYNANNHEKNLAASRESMRKLRERVGPEEWAKRVASWRTNNRAQARELGRRAQTRERAAAAGFTITAHHSIEEWQQLVQQYGGRCACCGQERKLTRDHVIPITRGGSDLIENIQPLCQPCNTKKGSKDTRWPLLAASA